MTQRDCVQRKRQQNTKSRPEEFQYLEIRYLKTMQERMKGLSREVKGKAKSLVLETVQKWMFQESRNYQFCECYLEVMT